MKLPIHETIDEFGDDVVAHQKRGNFHRLVLCCKPPQKVSDWVSHDEIATLDRYSATWNMVERIHPQLYPNG